MASGFADLISLITVPAQTGQAGKVLTTNGTALSWLATSGVGTVTSVALAAPSILTVTGSPITGAGTLTLSLATQTANAVFAGPASGGAVAPTFRALVAADIPNHDTSKLTSGTLAFARGGTGATTFANQRIPFSNGTNLLSDANFIYDTTNNRLTVGGSGTARIGAVVASGSTVALQAYSQGTNNAFQIRNENAFALVTYTANNNAALGSLVGFGRSRGTQVARTQSLSGDTVLLMGGFGYTGSGDTTGFCSALSIIQTENATASANGGEMFFSTTPNGTTTGIERLRIKSTGESVFASAIATARLTTAQKLALNPIGGWVVFDTDLSKLSYYDGATWINL